MADCSSAVDAGVLDETGPCGMATTEDTVRARKPAVAMTDLDNMTN